MDGLKAPGYGKILVKVCTIHTKGVREGWVRGKSKKQRNLSLQTPLKEIMRQPASATTLFGILLLIEQWQSV